MLPIIYCYISHKFILSLCFLTFFIYVSGQYHVPGNSSPSITTQIKDGYDFAVSNRFDTKPLGYNIVNFRFGKMTYRRVIGGMFDYRFESNTFGLGPYIRLFPFNVLGFLNSDIGISLLIDLNYQFDLYKDIGNEFNVSAGTVLYRRNIFGIEGAMQFTFNPKSLQPSMFRPVLSIHYYFRGNHKDPGRMKNEFEKKRNRVKSPKPSDDTYDVPVRNKTYKNDVK